MTRKDFAGIAAVFKGTKAFAHLNGQASSAWEYDVAAMADFLATQNPRFDRQKFLDACGF